ncbi:MAG TPA: AraC family transcriptional regulator [Bacteroidia bacterium]|nr:AraC family transcriptional regulator [Bacteroidia bacterium]
MKKTLPVYSLEQFLAPGPDNGIYVNTIPRHLAKYEFLFGPHRHDSFLVILCTKGKGRHEIDFNAYDIRPGSLFFIYPGQAHLFTLTEPADGYVFLHSKDFYETYFTRKKISAYPFFYCSHNTPALYLDPAQVRYAEELMKEMLSEFEGKALAKNQKICSLIDIAYIEMARIYLEKNPVTLPGSQHSMRIRQLEDLIEKNFRTERSPSFYASEMNMSAKQLNRICRETLGKTTSEMISDRVVLEAKRMLAHTDAPFAQIASELGYFDDAYFIRMFRKHSGKTPAAFAKKYREESIVQ